MMRQEVRCSLPLAACRHSAGRMDFEAGTRSAPALHWVDCVLDLPFVTRGLTFLNRV